jgi:hypothetical protein
MWSQVTKGVGWRLLVLAVKFLRLEKSFWGQDFFAVFGELGVDFALILHSERGGDAFGAAV